MVTWLLLIGDRSNKAADQPLLVGCVKVDFGNFKQQQYNPHLWSSCFLLDVLLGGSSPEATSIILAVLIVGIVHRLGSWRVLLNHGRCRNLICLMDLRKH